MGLHVGRSSPEPLILGQTLLHLVDVQMEVDYSDPGSVARVLVYLQWFRANENETMSFLGVVGNEEDWIIWVGGEKTFLNLYFLCLMAN